jgi:hypothetical protein
LVEIAVRLYAGLYGVTLSSAQIRELLGEINLQGEASSVFASYRGSAAAILAADRDHP